MKTLNSTFWCTNLKKYYLNKSDNIFSDFHLSPSHTFISVKGKSILTFSPMTRNVSIVRCSLSSKPTSSRFLTIISTTLKALFQWKPMHHGCWNVRKVVQHINNKGKFVIYTSMNSNFRCPFIFLVSFNSSKC